MHGVVVVVPTVVTAWGAARGPSKGLGVQRRWWSRAPLPQLITLSGSAQMVTSSGTKGNILTAYLAGALAVMVAIYTAGGVSGEAGVPALLRGLCSALLTLAPPAPGCCWLGSFRPPAPSPSSPLCCRGSPEPGFLPLHVPAGAAPAVEISHFRGRADLGIFHRRRSRLRPVLWYAEAHVHPGAVGTGCARGRRAAGVLALPVPHTEGSPAHVRWLCPADAIQFYSNGTLAASGPLETASIFATYPAEYLSLSNGFLDQVGASPMSPRRGAGPRGAELPAGPAGDGHGAADRGHPGHHRRPQQARP